MSFPTVLSGELVMPAALDDCRKGEGACGAPGAGSCFAVHAGLGCNLIDCCCQVCMLDPDCCDTGWDQDCVNLATEEFCLNEIPTHASSVLVTVNSGVDRRIDGFTITEGGVPLPANLGDCCPVSGGANVCLQANSGAGIRIEPGEEQGAGLTIVRCDIVNNRADWGGGIAIGTPTSPQDQVASADIWSCRINDNVGRIGGGGVYSFGTPSYVIANSELSRNWCPQMGCNTTSQGAPGLYDQVSPIGTALARSIVNCTVVRNRAPSWTGIRIVGTFEAQGLLTVANSIVRNNMGWNGTAYVDCSAGGAYPSCDDLVGSPTIVNCNIPYPQVGLPAGSINADPGLDDLDGTDIDSYRLLESSPCVDAGSDAAALADLLDVDNNGTYTDELAPDAELLVRWRPGAAGACRRVDIGAHELQGVCAIGNLDGDSDVDGGDLGILLGNWGGSGIGDINCDGVVNGADLGELLGDWNPAIGFPRTCEPGESSAMAAFGDEGAMESEEAGVTLADLVATLGLENTAQFVDWVTALPHAEMLFWLELIDG